MKQQQPEKWVHQRLVSSCGCFGSGTRTHHRVIEPRRFKVIARALTSAQADLIAAVPGLVRAAIAAANQLEGIPREEVPTQIERVIDAATDLLRVAVAKSEGK